MKRYFFAALLLFPCATALAGPTPEEKRVWKSKPESYWKEKLSPEQFKVCRKKGTEKAFSGEYDRKKDAGVYVCSSCGQALFSSKTKFDSGTGWPSYWDPIAPENVDLEEDNFLFYKRTEVLCSRCGAHLGHVFDDGPKPTGKRYCINSVCLTFVPAPKAK